MRFRELWKAVIIPIIVGIAIIVGALAPRLTHKKDSLPEVLAEDVIFLTTGREIDFSKLEESPNHVEICKYLDLPS